MYLAHEHRVLLAEHGAAQRRCSSLISAQQARIEALEAQAMRLRAAAILRETALAFAREDRAALEASIPGLSTRVTLARRVETLLVRIQVLMRERLHMTERIPPMSAPTPVALPAVADAMPTSKPVIATQVADHDAGDGNGGLGDLAASLVAADLVICQTGCLSHGDYWRVQDHCKRTGKACMLVAQPDALRIVRIERSQSPLATTKQRATTESTQP